MKSIVTDKPVPDEKPFPKLMISRLDGIIVLMEKDYTGMVVGNPNSIHPLGHFDEWSDTGFTDYTGTVKLSND